MHIPRGATAPVHHDRGATVPVQRDRGAAVPVHRDRGATARVHAGSRSAANFPHTPRTHPAHGGREREIRATGTRNGSS
jgi:hypothetical protein